MFGGKQPNPYDEIVTKTTDENLTSENWELILNLCDKVNDEGEQGARNVIAAVLKRLAHRNPTVQLYALALGEALSKNCGIELHREMASRSFTQGLEKLVTDRMTHEKVKRRTLHLISLWSGEFEDNAQLSLMEELYKTLKSKNFKFDQISEPPPPDVDDEVRRKEEEELQRVLEMSVHDKGGRNLNAWKESSSSSGAGASSSNATLPGPSSSGGYTPTEPSRSAYTASETHHHAPPTSKPQISAPSTTSGTSAQPPSATLPDQASPSTAAIPTTVSRVRALHTFEPTVAGELAFEKGDIIKVTDRAYDNWWRGQLRGRTGIFPVNYVEPLPDLTPGELAREAEQEAAVFAQAANIDKLINMLRGLDPAKDNLADNEEIQELYRSSMSLRPKIVKLIDKYSQKRAELVTMNENFVRARGVFEQMMEDSLARHTGVYDNAQPTFRTPRPDSRATPADYRASTYGWNPTVYEQPGYNAYPAAPAAYVGADQQQQHPQQTPYQGQPYGDPNAYGAHHNYGGQGQPQGPQPYPPTDAYNPQQHPQQGPTQPPHQPQPYGHAAAASEHAQSYGHGPAPTDPAAYAQQNPQAQSQPQPQPQPQSQAQSQTQPQQGQKQQGPPYVYDHNTQYADPNVQAWAQYYAQGGKDTAGAIYFVSVPGVTDVLGQNSAPPPQAQTQPHPTATETPSDQHPTQPTSAPATAHSAYNATSSAHPTSPPPDQAHYPAQGQAAYQGYSAPPQTTSPPADQTQHPHLHIQPGYHPPDGTAPQAGPGGPYAASSAVGYGPATGTPQSYIPGGYPAPQGPTSPHEVRPRYEAQSPPTDGTQQGQVSQAAPERVGA